jgi:CubicO group peptidase (beta-lactamase class C family)
MYTRTFRILGSRDSKCEHDVAALERYVRSLHNEVLLWGPGERCSVSNMAYEVIGDLVSKISGISFEDYVAANILKPLDMESSTLLIDQVNLDNLAAGYTKNQAGALAPVTHYPDNRAHMPSSLLYSNILDMAKWVKVNLGRSDLKGRRILKASSYDTLWKPMKAHVDTLPHYEAGVGWFLTHRKALSVGKVRSLRQVDSFLVAQWLHNRRRTALFLPRTTASQANVNYSEHQAVESGNLLNRFRE